MYQLQYLSYLMVLTLGKASGFANLINYFKIGGWKKSQLQYAKFVSKLHCISANFCLYHFFTV